MRLTTWTDVSPIDDLIGYLESMQDVSNEALEEAIDEVRPVLLDELRFQPPRRKYPQDYPIRWTSEKQRRFVFSQILKQDSDGNIIPYQRTGKLAESWQVMFTVQSGEGTVIVENTYNRAQFIYGALAQDESRAKRFQQKWHVRTGWEFAKTTVDYWLDVILERWQKKLNERIGEFVKGSTTRRRAFHSKKKSL